MGVKVGVGVEVGLGLGLGLGLRRERLLSDLRQEDLVRVVVEDLPRVEASG